MNTIEIFRKKGHPFKKTLDDPHFARLNVGTSQELQIGDWIEMDEDENIRVVGHSDIVERCGGTSLSAFDITDRNTYRIKSRFDFASFSFKSAFLYKINVEGKVERTETRYHPLVWLFDNKPDFGDAWLVCGFYRTCPGTPYSAVYVRDGRITAVIATEDSVIFELMLIRPRKPSFWDRLRKRMKDKLNL